MKSKSYRPVAPSASTSWTTSRGITNIGRSPSNDLVLDSPGVPDYAASIDHRQPPFQLTELDGGSVRVGGLPLAAHGSRTLAAWDTVEIGDFTLVMMVGNFGSEAGAAGAAAAVGAVAAGAAMAATAAPYPAGSGAYAQSVAPSGSPSPSGAAALPVAAVAAAGGASPAVGQQPMPTLGPPIPDEQDDAILTEIGERVQTVDVEQTGTWQITLINGSPLVSRFEVHVDGWIDPDWVTILPDAVNLTEGGRAMVTVQITPPRVPTSLAGAHHLAIVVTSPTHPGHRSRRGATLNINPYYEYTVDQLSPVQQTIPYRRKTAQYEISLQNRGNSQAGYRIEAADTENACKFVFPDERGMHIGLREMRLGPTEERAIPLQVSPHKRSVIGGTRTYSLRATATPLEGTLMPMPLMGELRQKAMFGRWILLLLALLIAIVLVILLRPRIDNVSYTYETPSGELVTTLSTAERGAGLYDQVRRLLPGAPPLPTGSASAADAVVVAGRPVTVTWRTSNVGLLSLGQGAAGEQNLAVIQAPEAIANGNYGVAPQPNLDKDGLPLGPAVYALRAENWMRNVPLIGALGTVNRPFSIDVVPAEPVDD